ncbi:MAG: hypothetical protein K2J77_09770 [Oscillospiraceae bacterium]|nr:hypothetical protein [Oscillospiraceae bacterium]
MKLTKLLRTAVAAALTLTLAGCSMSVSVETLLSPPTLSAEQEEIYRELEKSVGRNIKLKYPRGGDFRSAFVVRDIDGDDGDEALVFYESSDIRSGDSALRLKFLDKRNDKWEAAFDLACPGNEIDSVAFENLGGDEYGLRIILSYTLLNQTEKAVSVLKYVDGAPIELLSSTCSCLEVTDLNRDGQNELVIVTSNKEQKTAAALMYAEDGESMRLISSASLRGGASEYLRVTIGDVNPDTPALFFDYSMGGGQSGTDVVYCYGNGLFSPTNNADKITRRVNDYTAEVYSFDIDGDDVVEIPATEPLPGYESSPANSRLCAVRWYNVKNDSFVESAYSYYSGKFGYSLMFPERWIGNVTAIAEHNSNSVLFIAYDSETGLKATSGNMIMRIRVVEKSEETSEPEEEPFAETDELMFFCDTLNSPEMTLSASELEDSFVILE